MADVIEAAVKLPGIGNDRIAAVGVTGRVYSQAKRYVHSGPTPNPILELLIHVLPTNAFIKSDGPRIVLPLVQPPADGAGTAEDRFYNYFTLDHWMPMQLTTMTGCSTTSTLFVAARKHQV